MYYNLFVNIFIVFIPFYLPNSCRLVNEEEEDVVDSSGKPGKVSLCLRLTVKLIFLAFIMVLGMYFYQVKYHCQTSESSCIFSFPLQKS